MGDTDYAPAIAPDEEEQKRRLAGLYPPAPAPLPAPAMGSTADLEARAAQPKIYPAPEPIQAAAPVKPRPQPSDYPAAELHGWKKGLGAAFTGMAAYHSPEQGQQVYHDLFQAPGEKAQKQYETAAASYDKEQADKLALGKDEREGNVATADIGLKEAETDKALHPPVPEAEKPLTNANQLNQTLARRFQVLHPGQALPPDYTLPPNATSGDYARVDKSLEAEEKAIGVKQTGDVHEADRKASVQAEASRHADSERDRGEARNDRLQRQTEQDTEKHAHQAEQEAQKHQAARDKFVEPIQGAIDNADYQKQYAESGNHTGTGDYTMMLQLQEAIVAGQKAGIRFNTAEQARIEHAQNLMNSLHAKWGHLTGGTYFSDDQRHEIADAMQHVSLIHKQAINRWDREHGGAPAAAGAEQGGGAKAPAAGTVEGGYRFKGGDPSKKENWEKQ